MFSPNLPVIREADGGATQGLLPSPRHYHALGTHGCPTDLSLIMKWSLPELSNILAADHMWVVSIRNMDDETEKLILFHLT